jgi:hypothetical protein
MAGRDCDTCADLWSADAGWIPVPRILVGCAAAFARNSAARQHVIKRLSLVGMTEAALCCAELCRLATWPLALHPEFAHGHWVIAAKTFGTPVA